MTVTSSDTYRRPSSTYLSTYKPWSMDHGTNQSGGEVSCMVYGLYNLYRLYGSDSLYRLYGHTGAAGQGRSDVWFVWRPIQHVFLYGGLYET